MVFLQILQKRTDSRLTIANSTPSLSIRAISITNYLITNIPHTAIMVTRDLKSGYVQLAINPKDIEKTAFITRNGTFALLRMSFGLSEATPNFQKAINIILKPVLGRFVNSYMDDVIITSPSFNDHLDHLNQVFTLLRDAGLTLNKNKCHFARDKLKYLGLIISRDGIETNNNKVTAITEMKPPKNNKEVSKFLEMAGWYQKSIPHYADICEPLYSGVGIDAVLNQNHIPIAFASRTLNKAERNYTVTYRECLALIWALNRFRTYFGTLPVKAIAKALLENYISRYGASISLISDNGPQFISDVFEHLSHRDNFRSSPSTADEEVSFQLKKKAGEEQEYSLTRPERPGQHVAKDTVQLMGDQSDLERQQQ
ncbi:retrovirus-related Pol polyprotein from transposon 297 [Trichonephila clavipes]|nr:retrovirus-related Pol polyprotein from transposon 297 [Trichonephila clavipes]